MGKGILVVDDAAFMRMTVKNILEKGGYEVVGEAGDGAQAVKQYAALKPEDIQPYVDDGSVELPGEVKDPVAFYNAASVFVLPSYYREGLPRTILEAIACGRPVITTDWTGCREAVEDGVNGYLVPIKDAKALAEKMALLCDRDTAVKMGDAAHDLCKRKFEVGIINRQMRAVIGY